MQRDATANWTERRMRITVSCTKVTCLTCSRVFSSPRVYYKQVDSCRKSVIFNLAILPKTSAVLLAVVCSKFVGSFCCPYLVNSLPSVGDQGGELCQVPMAFAHCLSHLESPFGLCLHLCEETEKEWIHPIRGASSILPSHGVRTFSGSSLFWDWFDVCLHLAKLTFCHRRRLHNTTTAASTGFIAKA